MNIDSIVGVVGAENKYTYDIKYITTIIPYSDVQLGYLLC
jgi:hypothetical protein